MKQKQLTISQLASFAKVTVRAVRHYHEIGLLPEPSRDESGYRRYDATAVINLMQIKTLADAGVPLLQIHTLLHADAVDFSKTIERIETDITKRIAKLQQTKEQLVQLKSGEAMYLPSYVSEYLTQLRGIGISETMVTLERNGWLLLVAALPTQVASLIKEKSLLLNDPQIIRLYQLYDQTSTWDSNDPRLGQVADEITTIMASYIDTEPQETIGEARAQSLISMYDISPYPAWKHLEKIIQTKTR